MPPIGFIPARSKYAPVRFTPSPRVVPPPAAKRIAAPDVVPVSAMPATPPELLANAAGRVPASAMPSTPPELFTAASSASSVLPAPADATIPGIAHGAAVFSTYPLGPQREPLLQRLPTTPQAVGPGYNSMVAPQTPPHHVGLWHGDYQYWGDGLEIMKWDRLD